MTEYYTVEKNKERMKIIKTYYLIDYENVGSEGFKGCGKLRETDIIHLFYTDNSRKIDLDIINDHGESKLITHKVLRMFFGHESRKRNACFRLN